MEKDCVQNVPSQIPKKNFEECWELGAPESLSAISLRTAKDIYWLNLTWSDTKSHYEQDTVHYQVELISGSYAGLSVMKCQSNGLFFSFK